MSTRILLALALTAAPAAAQNADSAAIVSVVQKLFEGMKKKDTTAMRALFVPESRMLALTQAGQVRASSVDGWLLSVGREGPVLDERTWGYEVRVDQNIAQAWVQYALYVGPDFRHCGVDAFDFLRVGGTWKILSVMDTRRTTGCATPPAGKE